jgi:hypothetical protein
MNVQGAAFEALSEHLDGSSSPSYGTEKGGPFH